MPLHRYLSGLLVLLGAFSAHATNATAESHGGSIGYTLVDLDPDDGIAPSFSWAGQGTGLLIEIPFFESRNWDDWGDHAIATEGIRGQSTADSVHLQVDASHLAGARLTSGRGGNFLLSPQTQVTFYALVSLSLSADGVFTDQWTSATLSMYPSSEPIYDSATLTTSGATTQQLSLSYSNNTAQTFAGHVGLYQGIHFEGRVPPIPEPGGMMLLMAGLSVLGVGRAACRCRDGHGPLSNNRTGVTAP